MAGKVLEEVSQVAFIRVVLASPLVQVGMSGEVLTANAIDTGVRINVAILEDHRLHVLVNRGNHSRLLLVDFVESEEFGQVDDLRALEGQGQVQIGVHLVSSHGHEQILVLNVPHDCLSFGLEVRNHDKALIDGVQHVAVACSVNANALRASLVREDLLERVLALVFQDESLVVDQVVAELTTLVDQQ